jgi:hypothetical protein
MKSIFFVLTVAEALTCSTIGVRGREKAALHWRHAGRPLVGFAMGARSDRATGAKPTSGEAAQLPPQSIFI